MATTRQSKQPRKTFNELDAELEAESKAEVKADEGLVEIIGSSLSKPGHRRGGHFWPAGTLAKAMLTPAQAAQVCADKRITIFDPNAEIPSTEEVEQSLQTSIKAEMNRIKDERDRQQAVDNLRRRTEPSAGARDFPDKRR